MSYSWPARKDLAASFAIELALDLHAVDTALAEALLTELRRSKLILIRRQDLDEEAYIRLGAALGRLWTVDCELSGNAEGPHAVAGRVEIARVSNKGGMLEDRAVDWHGDLAHHPTRPYPGRVLYAKAMPDDAVSVTSWVDLEYCWTDLFTEEDRRILMEQSGEFRAGYETEWGATRHKIIQRHPARGTDWPAIDRAFLRHFVGMSPEASSEFKKHILRRILVGSAMYRHVWEKGDVIIYDNEGTIHRRERVFSDQERTIWRLTLSYAWERAGRTPEVAENRSDPAGVGQFLAAAPAAGAEPRAS